MSNVDQIETQTVEATQEATKKLATVLGSQGDLAGLAARAAEIAAEGGVVQVVDESQLGGSDAMGVPRDEVGAQMSDEELQRQAQRIRTSNAVNCQNYSRRQMVIGIERTLKHNGIGPNSPCVCGSGMKYKKCCRHLLNNKALPIDKVMSHMGLSFRQPVVAMEH